MDKVLEGFEGLLKESDAVQRLPGQTFVEEEDWLPSLPSSVMGRWAGLQITVSADKLQLQT